jgi:two-component system, response regulator PdtaR
MRVLVAEDDPVIALGLESKLRALGHEIVARVGEGSAAVAEAARTAPDAILMDLVMPGVDGLEAARQVSAERPTPIVAITAYDDPHLVERAIHAGVAGYLVKPVSASQIESALQVAVTRHAEFTALRAQVDELADALETRKVVERAKGILMDRAGLSESDAFARIQRRARDHNRTMIDVAREIIAAADVLE